MPCWVTNKHAPSFCSAKGHQNKTIAIIWLFVYNDTKFGGVKTENDGEWCTGLGRVGLLSDCCKCCPQHLQQSLKLQHCHPSGSTGQMLEARHASIIRRCLRAHHGFIVKCFMSNGGETNWLWPGAGYWQHDSPPSKIHSRSNVHLDSELTMRTHLKSTQVHATTSFTRFAGLSDRTSH